MHATMLGRVPAGAGEHPIAAGDLVAVVADDGYRPGDLVVAILPGGQTVRGVLLHVASAWWLLDDDQCVALGPGIRVFHVVAFRPI